MALVLGVNSYATVAEANEYFMDRIDVAAWTSADDTMKGQSLVTASQLVDQFRYAGNTATDNQALAFPRQGRYIDDSRGRAYSFDSDYTFTELDVTSSTNFWNALVALSLDIQRLKKATFEQAYHLINVDGVLDTTVGTSDANSITVGSITISGSHVSGGAAATPERSKIALDFIRPLFQPGGNNWFRAN